MNSNRIKVLVVEDSLLVQQHLVRLLNADARMEVVGTANNGLEAMQFVAERRPDVVMMDVNMPQMDGFEATRRIMEDNPLPIVIVSAVWSPDEEATTFRAVEAGALAVVATPPGPDHPSHVSDTLKLLNTVRAMSEVRVVRRRGRGEKWRQTGMPVPPAAVASNINLVAIGASTGGPPVLQLILASLPKDYAVPVLIVQHIAVGFVQGLVQWLKESTGFAVQIAEPDEVAMPGRAYFAPDNHHLTIGTDGRFNLSVEPSDNGLRPSISRLFSSVSAAYGSRSAGVLLTGMGRDGAEQLKQMRQRGALTIAQDEASCLVYGMPGEAAKIQAAEYILPPDQIATLLAVAVKTR